MGRGTHPYLRWLTTPHVNLELGYTPGMKLNNTGFKLTHSYGLDHQYPCFSAKDEYRRKTGNSPPQDLPEWMTLIAFRVQGNKMRHMRCCVIGNIAHETTLPLRSDIASGVSFIRRVLQVTKDARQTIPVCPCP